MKLNSRLYFNWDEAAEVLGLDREGLRQFLSADLSPANGQPRHSWLPVLLDPANLELLGTLDWAQDVGDPAYGWTSRNSYYPNTEGKREVPFSSGESFPLRGDDGLGQSWSAIHDLGTGHNMCFALVGRDWVMAPRDVASACKDHGRITTATIAPFGWCEEGFSRRYWFHWITCSNTLYQPRPVDLFFSARFRHSDVAAVKAQVEHVVAGLKQPPAQVGSNVGNTPLGSRERNNLLRVITALAKEAKIDIGSDRAALQIEAAVALAGFDSPKQKTISSILAKARSLD